MSRVVLESLGCKLNQAEMEALADRLAGRGHVLSSAVGEADVYVLNTCSVTHVADRKSRQALRAARRARPGARVVATGCYARRAPEELRQLGVADAVVGRVEGDALIEAIEDGGHVRTARPAAGRTERRGRTRSLVKIQEGCGDLCTFCVVPHTRGPGRSRTPDDVLAEVSDKAARGHREVVLTGTKLGDYEGNGGGPAGLPGLVRRILAQTSVERLRLSSVQPADLTPEFLALWRDERLCPHLHLPLQSGSDAILRRMRRPYSRSDYERAVVRAREAIPDLSVTTDVVVGFPGETEGEFEETCRFCDTMGFAGIHVFPYSRRPGTPAAAMPSQVHDGLKRQRGARMAALSSTSAARFRSAFLGRKMAVLWEEVSADGLWSGHAANYLRVYAPSREDLAGRVLAVLMTEEYADGVGGRIVNGGHHG
jgi:threonylcarbamoyladenosine tRNA methylthiotransferase MtaB